MKSEGSIPRATFLASSGSMIARPELDYPFDRAADREAFMARGREEERRRKLIYQREYLKEQKLNHNAVDVNAEEVDQLRKNGVSELAIAEQMGISTRTLTRKCGNRHAKESPLTPEQKAEKMPQAARLLKLGVSQSSVAESIGVSQAAVSYWHRNGLLDDGRWAA